MALSKNTDKDEVAISELNVILNALIGQVNDLTSQVESLKQNLLQANTTIAQQGNNITDLLKHSNIKPTSSAQAAGTAAIKRFDIDGKTYEFTPAVLRNGSFYYTGKEMVSGNKPLVEIVKSDALKRFAIDKKYASAV